MQCLSYTAVDRLDSRRGGDVDQARSQLDPADELDHCPAQAPERNRLRLAEKRDLLYVVLLPGNVTPIDGKIIDAQPLLFQPLDDGDDFGRLADFLQNGCFACELIIVGSEVVRKSLRAWVRLVRRVL